MIIIDPSQFIDWLAKNPWLAVTIYIITVISLLLTIIFYDKGKKVKLPYYAVKSYNIIKDLDSTIDLLEVLYSGKRIENFTATKIAFWNAGNDTINSDDITSTNPLTINITEGYKILNAKILQVIEPANQFEIDIIDDMSIGIHFDYLDKNQGAIIQLLHTGKSEKDIEIKGKIKGVGEPIRKSARISHDSISLFNLVIIYGFSIFLFLLLINMIFNILIEFMNGNIADIYEIIFGIILFTIIISFCWGLAYLLLRQTLLPKGFKIFEEEIFN